MYAAHTHQQAGFCGCVLTVTLEPTTHLEDLNDQEARYHQTVLPLVRSALVEQLVVQQQQTHFPILKFTFLITRDQHTNLFHQQQHQKTTRQRRK